MKNFNEIELSLMEGDSIVYIYPSRLKKEILFKLYVDGNYIKAFGTYTDACQWIINTVNQIKE